MATITINITIGRPHPRRLGTGAVRKELPGHASSGRAEREGVNRFGQGRSVLMVETIVKISDRPSVPIPKSLPFYAFAQIVRRQKRWMLARMSSAVLIQRNGFGSAFVASI